MTTYGGINKMTEEYKAQREKLIGKYVLLTKMNDVYDIGYKAGLEAQKSEPEVMEPTGANPKGYEIRDAGINNGCDGCAFSNENCELLKCRPDTRKDKRSVIFVKIEDKIEPIVDPIDSTDAPEGYMAILEPDVRALDLCTGCAFDSDEPALEKLCTEVHCTGGKGGGEREDEQCVIFVKKESGLPKK
jgi:hypothetical protein